MSADRVGKNPPAHKSAWVPQALPTVTSIFATPKEVVWPSAPV
jgi:hypothetical protein